MIQVRLFIMLCSLIAIGFPGYALAATVEETVEDTMTVQSVDVPNRLVTVTDSAGDTETLQVSTAVKNLPQLKPGDRIQVAYHRALAADIKKPGEASTDTQTRQSLTTAPAGAKPGMQTQQTVETTITVKAVDPARNTLTFVGPQGRTRTITVEKPEMQDLLKKMKPGDRVQVAYTEALAVDVKPAKQ